MKKKTANYFSKSKNVRMMEIINEKYKTTQLINKFRS